MAPFGENAAKCGVGGEDPPADFPGFAKVARGIQQRLKFGVGELVRGDGFAQEFGVNPGLFSGGRLQGFVDDGLQLLLSVLTQERGDGGHHTLR